MKHLLTIVLLSLLVTAAQGRRLRLNRAPIPNDTLCIVEDSAYLYFPKNHEAWQPFYDKLLYHLAHQSRRINILHIGGSHVQAGYLSGRMRHNLSSIIDSASYYHSTPADYGVTFPFRTLHTNAPTSYSTSSTGRWSGSKCLSPSPDAILGLSGAAAITYDPSATMTLSMPSDLYAFDRIRVLGYSNNSMTHPVVVIGTDTIYPSLRDRQSGYLFHLPSQMTQCTIAFNNVTDLTPFYLRGMIPMSSRHGITYSESGINGAAVPSWLGCGALKEELKLLPPDLAIFAIGVNDAATTYDSFSPEYFKDNYRQLLNQILEINPNTALLFITNNDCYQAVRVRRPNLNTARVAQAFKELAHEYNGAVFNLYEVMGGQGSAAQWVRHGWMQSDRVHFTKEGYQLVADLLYNALITDFTHQIDPD